MTKIYINVVGWRDENILSKWFNNIKHVKKESLSKIVGNVIIYITDDMFSPKRGQWGPNFIRRRTAGGNCDL